MQGSWAAAAVAAAVLVAACGGGGGNPGRCSGSPEYCAAEGAVPGGSGAGTGSGGSNAGTTLFDKEGTGAAVLAIPGGVTRLRIEGTANTASPLFTVRLNARTLVNEVLGGTGEPTTFRGTFVASSGTLEITNATGVTWKVTSVAPDAVPSAAGNFFKSGQSADVFELPAKAMRVRIQAGSARANALFTVRVANSALATAVVGTTAAPASFDGIYSVDGGLVEVTGHGVAWTFTQVP